MEQSNINLWFVIIPTVLAAIPIYLKFIKPFIKRIRSAAGFAKKAYTELSPENPESIRGRMSEISINMTKIRSMTRMILDKDAYGAFETDKAGKCIWANKSFLTVTESAMDDILGNGWISAIHADDRDRVYNEWHDAVEQERIFVMDYRLHGEKAGIIHVHCEATPMIYVEVSHDGIKKELIGYLGWVNVVENEPSDY